MDALEELGEGDKELQESAAGAAWLAGSRDGIAVVQSDIAAMDTRSCDANSAISRLQCAAASSTGARQPRQGGTSGMDERREQVLCGPRGKYFVGAWHVVRRIRNSAELDLADNSLATDAVYALKTSAARVLALIAELSSPVMQAAVVTFGQLFVSDFVTWAHEVQETRSS
jgi:hypothetical protein